MKPTEILAIVRKYEPLLSIGFLGLGIVIAWIIIMTSPAQSQTTTSPQEPSSPPKGSDRRDS